ncbi:G2-specific serine/threonine protein kinase [Arthrobotrys megalospora]
MALRELIGKDPTYDFISPLGQGGFGSVAKVRRVSDGKIMACKAIDCSPHPNIKKLAYQEIKACTSFASSERYIANFSSDATWTEETQTIRLYMEYYEGGDLQGVIDECKHQHVKVHPFIATYWAMEMARGVKACHDHGIIHRDLKPGNVLLAMRFKFNDMLWAVSDGKRLTDEQRDLAKEFLTWLEKRPIWCHITDFGLGKFSSVARSAQRFTPASFVGGVLGTPGFMAPETMGTDIKFSVKSDTYSLGCLIYSLCSCRPPPSSRASATEIFQIPEMYPRRLRDVIERCMQQNPDHRPSSWEVVNETSDAYMDILEDRKFGQMRIRIAEAMSSRSGNANAIINQNPTSTSSSTRSSIHNFQRPALPAPDGRSKEELNNLLRDATYREDSESMKAALEAGANPNIPAFDEQRLKGVTTLRSTFTTRGLIMAEEIIRRSYLEITLLESALVLGSLNCVSLLLRYGAEYDSKIVNRNPLILSAWHNHPQVIDFLITAWGLDINTKTEPDGDSALSIAAARASLDSIKLLLQRKAKPFIENRNCDNPAHLVGSGAELMTVDLILPCYELLLKAAPYLMRMENRYGNTPLHSAVQRGMDRRIIRRLVIAPGANPYHRNKMGRTAFEIAEESYPSEERSPIKNILGLVKRPITSEATEHTLPHAPPVPKKQYPPDSPAIQSTNNRPGRPQLAVAQPISDRTSSQPIRLAAKCEWHEYVALEEFKQALPNSADLDVHVGKLASLNLVNIRVDQDLPINPPRASGIWIRNRTEPAQGRAYPASWTPLIGCIRHQRFEAAEQLIELGALVSIGDPLHVALSAHYNKESTSQCQNLMNLGVLLDRRGRSAADYFWQESVKLIQIIVEKGANVNDLQYAYNKSGTLIRTSPLHLAVWDKRSSFLVEYLLSKGASTWNRDSEQNTPLDLAKSAKRKDLVRIFEQVSR